MAKLFGYEINFRRASDELPSIGPPTKDDGALILTQGGVQGTYVDLDGNIRNEAQLVSHYREMEEHPEVRSAVKKIINDMIVIDEDTKPVEIVLDDVPGMTPQLNEAVHGEFNRALELLEFNTHAFDIASRFYVDGRLYYETIIDTQNLDAGIQELRYHDPRKLRKVREIERPKAPNQTAAGVPGSDMVQKVKAEYYVYNKDGFLGNTNQSVALSYSPPVTGMKIAKGSIIHITSGLTNKDGSLVISHLHQAIKPLNQLRCLEDAAIIYRLARAPERRIFTIEIGDMPKAKAEQYMRDLMDKYKNKLVYDASTGKVRDDRKHMTMLEDFWIPTRDGRGTHIDTLAGGNATGVMDEVEFFRSKLLAALEVPYARNNPDAFIAMGPGAAEIQRDELEFAQFVDRLRLRFNTLFLSILERQLVLRKIITPEEWPMIAYYTKFKYARNNLITEMKEGEIMMQRANRAQMLLPFVGKVISWGWMRRNVFKQTQEDIEMIDLEIADEARNPQFMMPGPMDGGMMQDGGAMMPPPGMGPMALPPPQQDDNNDDSINKDKKK